MTVVRAMKRVATTARLRDLDHVHEMLCPYVTRYDSFGIEGAICRKCGGPVSPLFVPPEDIIYVIY